MTSETETEQPTGNATGLDATALETMIVNQPDIISTSITSHFDQIRAAAVLLAGARRVRLCGVGLSGFAAHVGEYILRSIGLEARAANAFDLAIYPANFEPGDLVIVFSHGGMDPFGSRVLLQAGHAGLKTVAISGQHGTMRGADVRVQIDYHEGVSSNAMFTASVAVLSAAAARCEPRSPLSTAVPALPEAVRAMLPSRAAAHEVVAELSDTARRALITGAGPSDPVATAGGLLIRRVARQSIDAMHLETALQGGLASLDSDDVLIQVAPVGPGDDRHADLAVVANSIGLQRWKIGGSPDGSRWHTPVPTMPDVISPVLTIIPLQWLALELARAKSINPDDYHYEEAFEQISR